MFARMFREGRDYVWNKDAVDESPERAAAEWTVHSAQELTQLLGPLASARQAELSRRFPAPFSC
jgi:hypothetical protein